MVALRRTPRAERRLATVLFNFPPNAGAAGSAAHLAVWESLHRTLQRLAAEGYTVEVPPTVDALRDRLLEGNAARYGVDGNVHVRIPADEHVRSERWLADIEAVWGAAPGKSLTNGSSLFVLGAQFGNVFVGLQPPFGYEGDPMRLMFEGGFAPTHAFAAFYRWIREDFGAHAVLHFGTHGALEFMPGKQSGMSEACWPDRLIGDLPNLYLYAANNPSEGMIAKRRSNATLISYLTPPVTDAGLYKGLADLKALVDRSRATLPGETAERAALAPMIADTAASLELDGSDIVALTAALNELEATLIPDGLHVIGEAFSAQARVDLLLAVAESREGPKPGRPATEALVRGADARTALGLSGLPSDETGLALFRDLLALDRSLADNPELTALVDALDGRYVRPSPGGDLLRNPEMLPTGRNIHGFDPFRIPSAYATADGARQADRLLAKHAADGQPFPESVAIVLWGTDNLKSEGGPIAQAMALMGARPRFDSYGRLAGAELIPLETLGRPRVDVICTVSGIFRDLLPLQTRMLADAAWLAATGRRAAGAELRPQARRWPTSQARLRHGDGGAARVLQRRGRLRLQRQPADRQRAPGPKRKNSPTPSRPARASPTAGAAVRSKRRSCSRARMAGIDLAYQNLDSLDLGVTTIDHYVDTLGGRRPLSAARQGRGRPRLHRRPDAGRG
jgi:magnesium chelatase subunit H